VEETFFAVFVFIVDVPVVPGIVFTEQPKV
jgi:hypothetical protein